MKIKETTFGQLKQGDRFALSRGAFKSGPYDFMNIKVEPAVLVAPGGLFRHSPALPFNVIALGDGRVRTFRDEEKVLVLETA